jgi:phosphoribosylanthranilate isomerase
MPRIRVKFCGITRLQDALEAARLGADAIGLVFHEASPRAVTIEQARSIAAALPPFVAKVALFVDAGRARIEAVLATVPIDLLQFHGSEPPDACVGYDRPYLKAVRMAAGVDLREQAERYRGAVALLADTHVVGVPGGTGVTFDWSLIPADVGKPVVLAGGLTPDNVAAAIKTVQPYAVDVSGGIELAKGIKDPARMRAFMNEVLRFQ